MNTFDPLKLLRQDLSDFAPYVAPTHTTADLPHLIKLDSNENPYGPSPKTLEALSNWRLWNRYVAQDELLAPLAGYLGVRPGQVVVGNGGDEVIDLVQRIYIEPGDAIVDCPPSFEMYRHYARINGARLCEVSRREDFSLDVDAIEGVVEQERPKLIFVTSPGNPDGGVVPRETLERLLALPAVIVLDEAYAEFASVTLARESNRYPNLVILRTFSKWAGLAGLRVGCVAAAEPVVSQVMRIRSPYNVNMAAIVAVRAALSDVAHLHEIVRRIVAERERLSAGLSRLGFVAPLPSAGNFLLCRVIGRDAHAVRDALAQRRIMIRAYNLPRLLDYVRISVGTPEQDDMLLQALAELE